MKKSLFLLVIVLVVASMIATFSLSGCQEPDVVVETVTETVIETVIETVEVAAEEEVVELSGSATEISVNPGSPLDKIMQEGRVPRVGFIYLFAGHEYIDALIKGTVIGSEEWGFDLVLKDGQIDAAVIEKQLKAFIAEGIDYAIVQTLEGERLRPAFIEAYEADIPLCTINLWVDAPHPAHVGFNSFEGGRAMGEIAAEAINGSGTYVYVDASVGSSIAIGRKDGMLAAMADFPDIELLDSQYANDNRDDAFTVTEQFLIAYPDVDMIVVGTVAEAYGAIAAIEQAGKTGEVKVVTIDFPKSLIAEIENGNIYGSAYDNPVQIGKSAIDLAAVFMNAVSASSKWGEAEELEPAWKSMFSGLYLGSKKVTIDNLDEVKGDAF